MKILDTQIENLKIIYFDIFDDDRGALLKSWNKSFLNNLLDHNLESYVSFSRKGAIRGLHYQIETGMQKKLISCISGQIDDLVLDMNPNSRTYGKSLKIRLNGMDGMAVLVPEMCAHGTYSHEDSFYQIISNNLYYPDLEKGVLWSSIKTFDDLDIKYVSKKDESLPRFQDILVL